MIKAIVTDIEGTTSSLSFVKEVLFPYARNHMADFIRRSHQQPEVAQLLADVHEEAGRELNLEETIAQLLKWIDQDLKVTPLKSLQGLIWKSGYQQGDFQGHIYADAVTALQTWRQQGLALYEYSSGSVKAQKLLFAHTEYGDLTALFSDYFDTHIGGKKEILSYQRIARQIKLPAQDILFLSDIKDELDAAEQAGFHTYWLVRELEKIDQSAEHPQVTSFAGIDLPRF